MVRWLSVTSDRMLGRRLGRRIGARGAAVPGALIGACVLATVLGAGPPSAAAPSGAAGASGAPRVTAASPGKWTKIGTTFSGNPVSMWRAPNGRDWVLWQSVDTTYKVALLAPDGTDKETTALHVSGLGLAGSPVLVSNGAKPMVVFDGTGGATAPYNSGAMVGFAAGTWGAPWTALPWSLSQDTIIAGIYGAARNRAGVISADFTVDGGGSTLRYRIGVASGIPAGTPDSAITLSSGDVGYVSEAVGPGNDDFYAALGRFFTKPNTDGVYVADLSTHGPVVKAPGSGTQTVARESQKVAFAASSAKHGGLFVVYCNNTSSCSHLLFWRVGSKHAVVVPGSGAKFPGDWPSISAGPDGRIWVAWFNGENSRVYTVRTNKADTRFGPVGSYPTGLGGDQAITVSGGNTGRLDVVVGGYTNSFKPILIHTQSLTGLALSPGAVSLSNTSARKVVFKVTDAGDPVAGATVRVAGHTAKTNAGGKVTITFPKGTSPGKYEAKASAANYYSGTARVVVRT
jgi:hypothetical protein